MFIGYQVIFFSESSKIAHKKSSGNQYPLWDFYCFTQNKNKMWNKQLNFDQLINLNFDRCAANVFTVLIEKARFEWRSKVRVFQMSFPFHFLFIIGLVHIRATHLYQLLHWDICETFLMWDLIILCCEMMIKSSRVRVESQSWWLYGCFVHIWLTGCHAPICFYVPYISVGSELAPNFC